MQVITIIIDHHIDHQTRFETGLDAYLSFQVETKKNPTCFKLKRNLESLSCTKDMSPHTLNPPIHLFTRSEEDLLFALKGGVAVNGHRSWKKVHSSIADVVGCSAEAVTVINL